MINLTTLTAQQLSELIIDATAELAVRAMPRDEALEIAESFLQEEIDEIMSKAHSEVETDGGHIAEYNPNKNDSGHYDKIEFIVNEQKRTVVALIKICHNTRAAKGFIWKRAIAKCNPEDEFNETVGKYIALHRALDLELPIQF